MTLMAEAGCGRGLGDKSLPHGCGQAIGQRFRKVGRQKLMLESGEEERVGQLIERQ